MTDLERVAGIAAYFTTKKITNLLPYFELNILYVDNKKLVVRLQDSFLNLFMGYALSTSCNIIGNAGISLSHSMRVGISDSRCTGDHRVAKQVQKLDGYAHPIKIFTYQALGGVKTSLTLNCKEGLVNLEVFQEQLFHR
jgi:hypothetical protein